MMQNKFEGIEKGYIVDTSVNPLRSFEELNPKEKEEVIALKETLKDVSATSLINFSAATSSTISRDTDDFLRSTKLNDLEGFNQTMLELSNKLLSIDTKKLSEVQSNRFAKLPIIGSVMQTSIGKKVNEIATKQQTVENFVSSTETVLQKVRISLQEDLVRCTAMKGKNVEYAKALEFECIALQMRKKELEEELSSFMNSSEYNPNNLDDIERIDQLNCGIQEISRKIFDTASFRLNAIQDLPTLKITRNAEITIINKIDNTIVNIIPQWKKAFSKALLSYRLYNAATVLEAVQETSQQIFKESAKLTSEAVIKSAKMVEAPAIAIKTFEEINEILSSMVYEIATISTEAEKMRQDELSNIKNMEQVALGIDNQTRK